MRIRRNKPTNRREAFASMMWYAPMPGHLEMLPGYGGPEDEIVFLPSTPTVETVPESTPKPSLLEWFGLGKEVFQIINGVRTQVKDKQGRPVSYVPPLEPAPVNYTPWILGALGIGVLAIGTVVFLRSE